MDLGVAVELLNINVLGQKLRLEGSMAGWQQLFWGSSLVSEVAASADEQRSVVHVFKISSIDARAADSEKSAALDEQSTDIECRLHVDVQWQPFMLNYSIVLNGQAYLSGIRNSKDIEQQVPERPVQTKAKLSLVGLGLLAFKLLKSAKLVKVALAGASLAAYSWLFSFQFAVALILCLVVHEYGHVRAMRYFNIATKGIYLIPFFGGMAVSDSKINTRWQDVVISIMGPIFGLGLSLLLLLAYWITGNIFFAGLAVLNSLLNVINLLPILPLDGGHILKSVSFSMNSRLGLVLCVAAALAGILVSYAFGLTLLGLFLLLGSIEIFSEWRGRHQSHLLPLDRYGQMFASVWYLVTVSIFVAIIFYFASSGDPLLSLPLKILQS